MDAFDIALLMANQHADNPVRMRYGTVVGAHDEGTLSVVPDGQSDAVPAVKCCLPVKGSRVVLLVNGTEWLAVSVVGGDCPYEVGDYFITSIKENPERRWHGTRWERILGRFLWASPDDAGVGETSGEFSHALTRDEMPATPYWLPHNREGHDFFVSDLVDRGSYYGLYAGWIGRNVPHNNMPPYLGCVIWKRIK